MCIRDRVKNYLKNTIHKTANKIDIKTGNIKSEVYASWDYNSGVYIGNINNVNGAKVKINHEGDITSEAAAESSLLLIW